jgi:hypothetical protein
MFGWLGRSLFVLAQQCKFRRCWSLAPKSRYNIYISEGETDKKNTTEDLKLVQQRSITASATAMKCIAALTLACITANGQYLPESAGARSCARLFERCNGIVPPIGPCEVGASCTNGMYVVSLLNIIADCFKLSFLQSNCC